MTLDAPGTLTGPQRETWDETLHRIEQAGTTARVDPHSLHAYVVAVHTWQDANRLLGQSGALLIRGDKVTPNPALTVMTQAATVINSFASKYRLNWAPAMRDTPVPEGHASLPCDRCGEVHRLDRCQGHSRKGRQCTQARGERTDHLGFGNCAWHGGATPAGRKAAEKLRADAALFKLASDGEVTRMTDPLGAIAEMAAERRAWADAAIRLLNRLASVTGTDPAGAERLRAVVPLAERMSDRAFAAARAMAELDIDERIVAIQAQATDRVTEQVSAALDAFLVSLRDRLAPLLAPGAAWPGDAELEELLDGALAGVGRQ